MKPMWNFISIPTKNKHIIVAIPILPPSKHPIVTHAKSLMYLMTTNSLFVILLNDNTKPSYTLLPQFEQIINEEPNVNIYAEKMTPKTPIRIVFAVEHTSKAKSIGYWIRKTLSIVAIPIIFLFVKNINTTAAMLNRVVVRPIDKFKVFAIPVIRQLKVSAPSPFFISIPQPNPIISMPITAIMMFLSFIMF